MTAERPFFGTDGIRGVELWDVEEDDIRSSKMSAPSRRRSCDSSAKPCPTRSLIFLAKEAWSSGWDRRPETKPWFEP